MKSLKQISLIALAMTIITSCSIEKRVYSSGYHVEWKKNRHLSQDQETAVVSPKKSGNKTAKAEESVSLAYADDLKEEVQITAENDATPVISQNTAEAPATVKNFGKVVSFNKTTQTVKNNKTEVSKAKSVVSKSKIENKMKQKSNSGAGSGKSQIVALILAIVIGVLGIHRFYLGYTGIGILMLLTGGVCGILALIDIIRIALGDLKPRDSEYTETF